MDPNREEKGGIHIEILAMVHKFPRVVEQLSKEGERNKRKCNRKEARRPPTQKIMETTNNGDRWN